MKRSSYLYLFTLLIGALGCAAQSGPHYQREAKATLHGTFTNGGPPEGSQVAILYTHGSFSFALPWRSIKVAATPFSTLTPSEFEFGIYEPPPEDALTALALTGKGEPELRWTDAYIGILAPGADLQNVQPQDIVGISLSHRLLYLSNRVPWQTSSGPNSRWMGVVPSKGFHLGRVYPLTLPERSAEREMAQMCGNVDGFCVRIESDDYVTQEFNRWRFDQCMERQPTAETCTVYVMANPTPEQLQLTKDCQYKIYLRQCPPESTELCTRGGGCLAPPTISRNENDLNDPISLTMGATLIDALKQVN